MLLERYLLVKKGSSGNGRKKTRRKEKVNIRSFHLGTSRVAGANSSSTEHRLSVPSVSGQGKP